MRVKGKASTLGGSHHRECCGVVLKLNFYYPPVASVSVALILLRCSCRAVNAEECVGLLFLCHGAIESRGDDVLQCVDGVQLGAMCARPKLLQFHGQVGRHCQLWEEGPAPKPWASSLTPTYEDGFAIPIKSND